MANSRSLVVALLLLAAAFAGADESPLTNADVIRMTGAGLSADTIVAKIRSSRTAFATDTDALVALANAKVPDIVIRAMIETTKPAPVTRPAPKPVRSESQRRKRFDNVSVEAIAGGGRCTRAELELTTTGLQTKGCHETDVRASWSDIVNVCYAFGFRPAIIIRTSGAERRVNLTTPAELKALRDAVRSRVPRVVERSSCK